MSVRGIRLLPGGRLESGPFVIHPKALVGGSSDTNAHLSDNAQASIGLLRLLGGLEAKARGEDGSKLGGEVTVEQLRYADGLGERSRLFSAEFAGTLVLPDADLSAEASHRRSAEPEEDAPELAMRDRQRVGLAIDGSGRYLDWNLAVSSASLDYREDTPSFDRDVRDFDRLSATARLGLLGGRASKLELMTTVSSTTRNSRSAASDDHSFGLDTSWRHALAERTYLNLRLGAMLRQHEAPTAGMPENDDQTLLVPNGLAELLWWWDYDTQLTASIASGPAESIAGGANACLSTLGKLDLRLGLRDRLILVVDGLLMQRLDSGAAPGAQRMSQLDAWLSAGLEYRLRDGLAIRPWLEMQRVRQRDQEPADRLLVALEIAVAL